MQGPQKSQFTIGQVMALVAVVAGLLAVPHLQTPTEFRVAACVVALLPTLWLGSVLAEMLFGIRCPGCSRWTLRRLATNSSYYRCSHCRTRLKRFGFGPWLDASGPEDETKYRGKTGVGSWTGFAVPEDHADSTTGLLLRNKRRRARPRRPEG
jgi:hypothetical protein